MRGLSGCVGVGFLAVSCPLLFFRPFIKPLIMKFILTFLISFACFLVFRFDAKLSLVGSLALACFVAYLVVSIEEILNEL